MGKTRIAMGYVVNHFAFTGEGKKPRVLYVSVTSLFEDVVRDSDVGGDRLQVQHTTDNTQTRKIFNFILLYNRNSGDLTGKGKEPKATRFIFDSDKNTLIL